MYVIKLFIRGMYVIKLFINKRNQELMSAAKQREGASNSNMFCKPSVVKSHLCKLPYMENLCKLRK